MSIEPPFYHALSIAAQSMDLTLLEELGPLARAVHFIVTGAERYRDDQIESGFHTLMADIKNPLHTFCQSHFLFRCVAMKNEWIDQWKELVDKRRKAPPKAVKALRKTQEKQEKQEKIILKKEASEVEKQQEKVPEKLEKQSRAERIKSSFKNKAS